MDIQSYLDPNAQVDVAVDLGAVKSPLPDLEFLGELLKNPTKPPPQIIQGILHQGCKMVLGGTSKSNKSWCLLDLAISVASGQRWWGHACTQVPVVYVNFELHRWAIGERLKALFAARPECAELASGMALWNLRGHNGDLTYLRPQLEEQLLKHNFKLIILDPAYKVLGDRDENANGEIAGLMNEFEAMAQATGAAVVMAHHFAKGDSTVKSAMDRLSGAGAWARDPDSILILTPHEEEGCFTVSSIVRNLPYVPEFVVSWDFPLMKPASHLNPEALRRPQSKNKVCSDSEFVEALLGPQAKSFTSVIEEAHERLGMSRRTVTRYLGRLVEKGFISHAGGFYWTGEKSQ